MSNKKIKELEKKIKDLKYELWTTEHDVEELELIAESLSNWIKTLRIKYEILRRSQ